MEAEVIIYEAGKDYQTRFAWGRGYVISDSDAFGDWFGAAEGIDIEEMLA